MASVCRSLNCYRGEGEFTFCVHPENRTRTCGFLQQRFELSKRKRFVMSILLKGGMCRIVSPGDQLARQRDSGKDGLSLGAISQKSVDLRFCGV